MSEGLKIYTFTAVLEEPETSLSWWGSLKSFFLRGLGKLGLGGNGDFNLVPTYGDGLRAEDWEGNESGMMFLSEGRTFSL